ncbi:protein NEOXANTHIN-DEFICIENT 1 isoform X2 [Jatropha curcas]|uniref:protein NEOXANTHIN-DEFICIENT 1 isoform X2 n=2 Tax=Jatropha curcas TaxID=180498 RepID=UPI0009D74153|nr:protein NEOXANTHIN-DEFICIENT 1 isoform X2 [Jatropha curcas]
MKFFSQIKEWKLLHFVGYRGLEFELLYILASPGLAKYTAYISEIMGVAETKCSSGYGKPPWVFKGRYTLGGFFLANYEESPAGAFDELVVIAGIVWNPPTSCAWAARVLVSSNDACDHGRKEVGLPSHVAKFSKRIEGIPRQQTSKFNRFLSMIGLDTASSTPNGGMDVQVTEINGPRAINICEINLPTFGPGFKLDKGMGPAIKMSLPSFSGRTMHNPNLLKYSCNIECRVRTMQPAKVSGPRQAPKHDTEPLGHHNCQSADSSNGKLLDNGQNLSISVMLSKPILALEFSCLKMHVEAPITVSHCSESSCRNSLGVS